jgi:hypothetical protein
MHAMFFSAHGGMRYQTLMTFLDASPNWFLNPTSRLSVLGSLILSPISLRLKTENTQFRMNRLITLSSDTYGKLSDDFVRFLWMLANSASTNSRLSQPSSQDFANSSPDSFAPQVGSSFSHIRVRVRAAVAKAAAARFMPDSADNGLLVPVQIFLEQANSTDDLDLPLPTIFLCSINRVSVSLAFLCVCACSLMFCLCFCSFMLSRVFSTFSSARFLFPPVQSSV